MNDYQKVWWEQVKSDHSAFVKMRSQGFEQCHTLQFLQMVTEKLAKAFFWKTGSAPKLSHAAFVRFLRYLGQIPRSDRERIAALFGYKRSADFESGIRGILPIAYALERIAPDLSNDGPNSEYPWPHDDPQFAPATYKFEIWKQLSSGSGRNLMRIIDIAVEQFPKYADV